MPPKKQQPVSNDSTTLTKSQEEEMNSALIAKLLAQDAMDDGGSYYYAEYNNGPRQYDSYSGSYNDHDDSYEEESDDYAPKRYGKPKKPKAKKAEPERRGRKRKHIPMDVDTNTPTDIPTNTKENVTMETTIGSTPSSEQPSGTPKPEKPKKVKKPLPPGFKTGIYTDEEEVLFLEGMNIYGRNWNELSRHMGTRDPHSIRSHAQKHFIKLYRDNLPLPDKVKESGEGFTLSGKPLDPDSAAAKPYLNRSAMATKTTALSAPRPTTAVTITNTINIAPIATTTSDTTDPPKSEPMQIDSSTTCNSYLEPTNGTTQTTDDLDIGSISLKTTTKPQSASDPNSKKSKKLTSRVHQNESPAITYEDNGRTNYAASRLRRPESRNSIKYDNLNDDTDGLTMVKCEPFNGKPGSDTLGAQPFKMTVHSNVLLTMDFHAHLMTTEIIGFLAGEWDRKTKRLLVKEAFPCRSLNTGQNEVNVEMDPTSALETRQLIEEKNMTVVGWYHSHPIFVPDPSLVDIENQLNYQNLCKDECHPTNENTATSASVNILQDSATPGFISTTVTTTEAATTEAATVEAATTRAATTTIAAVEATTTEAVEALSLASPQNDSNCAPMTKTPELSDSKTTSVSSTSSPSSAVVVEPFVGAIVGPYDPRLPASASVFNWFHVSNDWNAKKVPKQLVYELHEDSALSPEEEARLFQLPIDYQMSPEKVNFNDHWRHNADETKLEKLIKSLGTRMPWIQKKLVKLQQEPGTVPLQQDSIAVPSSQVDVNSFTGGGQDRLETMVGDNTTEEQPSVHDANDLTDPFLEKVQARLKNW
ncbi:hypothetical protein BCR42DRAFT_448268 [Absidia repens]|uniref:Myb-like, SWIRM and MPN domain-containing protein 1 n=1 Tax=Absidia repens TaxID=90262 RepID=A0A1X2ISC4_9FUNG|nr:hypothetical protein BCR42DRAFT_448268 [Absidia repens]